MTSISKNINKYKHDTIGRFKDISIAISKLDELAFNHPESLELFHMIHEAFLKMIITSKEVIRHGHDQHIVLKLIDSNLGNSLKMIQIDGLNLRLDFKENSIIYYYLVKENQEDLRIACGKLMALLPLKEVSVELEDHHMQAEIDRLCKRCLNNRSRQDHLRE